MADIMSGNKPVLLRASFISRCNHRCQIITRLWSGSFGHVRAWHRVLSVYERSETSGQSAIQLLFPAVSPFLRPMGPAVCSFHPKHQRLWVRPRCLSCIIVAYALVTQLKTTSLRSMPLQRVDLQAVDVKLFLFWLHTFHAHSFVSTKASPTTTIKTITQPQELSCSSSAFCMRPHQHLLLHVFSPHLFCCRYIKNSFETTANFWNVISRSKKKASYMTKRGLSRYSSSLAYYCYIDCCSELLMDSLCLMVNLW